MSMVLVTGGSGFIGVHVILQLLAAGHEVRTTVRNLDRARDVVAMLREGGADAPDKVGFLAADLMRDEGWRAAAAGCDYVMHVASPLLAHVPEDENELIVPAREGTLRVLRAARDAGARRVVVTSSFAAIGYGYPPRTAPFDETSWTNLDGPDVLAYPKSKTLAERAAWDFIGREGNGLELAVVNPVAVFGPALGPDFSESIGIIRMLLEGAMPAVPRINLALVDVRDVADLHLRAMTSPEARGERFLAVAGETMSVLQIARVLRARLGAKARRVPRFQAPDWMLRLAARRNPMVRAALPLLGKVRQSTSAKARTLLGWSPRGNEELLVATAESLIRLGLVKA
ncbi:NAD-dependent epimerase/dehydratase family protein [Bradyrhizobium jicamae]|uniref:NAD-dependent epimerase/dehydratase family protein n=1 Tax=Bradyrhizobium jicamae TaxID=280332 RepID=UPI001BAB0B63|nr:NAD-dependent epimerase/dehydratase family protein [Bradyrhizobium jicamae]MBR0937450.1 NAD-dependent epimerase/dehydratase family protein [Bradyrhizobium jicamae]